MKLLWVVFVVMFSCTVMADIQDIKDALKHFVKSLKQYDATICEEASCPCAAKQKSAFKCLSKFDLVVSINSMTSEHQYDKQAYPCLTHWLKTCPQSDVGLMLQCFQTKVDKCNSCISQC